MSNPRTIEHGWKLAVVSIFGVLLLLLPPAAAQSGTVATDGKFEIGDGVDPTVPGVGDVQGDLLQAGPDWDDLFLPDRSFKDLYDEFGEPGSNGVPDFLDKYGKLRSDALFIIDDVSVGAGVDASVPAGPGSVTSGVVSAGNDIGNAYAYSLFNATFDPVLYLGVERLSATDGSLFIEFNQELYSVDGSGTIAGNRVAGDIRVRVDFASGVLVSVDLDSWALDEATQTYGWQGGAVLPGSPQDPAEQCNTVGTICAVCNGGPVTAGSWDSYDDTGATVTELPANTFLEMGINLGQLVGTHTYKNYYDTRFTSMQISTAEDYALGVFVRASKLAQFRTNQ